jgi:endonuclease-3
MLIEKFNGNVPQTQEELMTLPGVGRKSSDIIMRFVWGQPHIAVDTHVFRLLWRLGWIRSVDESKASIQVNALTPIEYKYGAHMWLITHAKLVCRSRNPLCSSCIIRDHCERRDITLPKNKLRSLQ